MMLHNSTSISNRSVDVTVSISHLPSTSVTFCIYDTIYILKLLLLSFFPIGPTILVMLDGCHIIFSVNSRHTSKYFVMERL